MIAETSRSTSRRLGFRYGLRTLFVVVTLVACWLGYESWIVRQRRATLERIKARGAMVTAAPSRMIRKHAQPASVPIIRDWMGDKPVTMIFCDVDTFSEEEIARIQTLYPEAWVAPSKTPYDTHFRTQ